MKHWKMVVATALIAGLMMVSTPIGATSIATVRPTPGYWLATGFGSTYAFNAPYLGTQLQSITPPVCTHDGGGVYPNVATCVDIASTSDGQGYWIADSSYIDEQNQLLFNGRGYPQGATGTCNSPALMPSYSTTRLVGIAAAPVGAWMVDPNGAVIDLCHAPFFGSLDTTQLNQPVVGMAATPDGKGYWLVAADGGVFGFGDAAFYGSMGSTPLNQPVTGIAPTPDGKGYWLVALDGGIFAFGDAVFSGSMAGKPLNAPMVDIAANPDGSGYWTVALDGGVFAFGDAPFLGSAAGQRLDAPIVGIASRP